MSLVSKALTELQAVYPDDPDMVMCYIEIISAFEAKSGVGIELDVLMALFQGHLIGTPTNNPKEWLKTDNTTWQNLRDPRIISDDGGRTYFIISDEEPRRRVSSPEKEGYVNHDEANL